MATAMRELVVTKPLAPDTFERVMAVAAIVLLAAMLIAIVRGAGEIGRLPVALWVHLATIAIALGLTPVMLLRRRGDRRHRRLGWVWAGAMFATALVTFDLRMVNPGRFSFIHMLSLWTMAMVPLMIWSARRHDVRRHRSAVRGMVLGALLIAGYFTFPFDRLLGRWLFG